MSGLDRFEELDDGRGELMTDYARELAASRKRGVQFSRRSIDMYTIPSPYDWASASAIVPWMLSYASDKDI
jgi:hypothetical protein